MSRQKSPNSVHQFPAAAAAEPEARPNGPLDIFLQPAEAKLTRYRTEAVDFARRDPEKALLWAVAAGYVLRLLPITRILGLVLSVLQLAWMPVALFFGGRALLAKIEGSAPAGSLRKK